MAGQPVPRLAPPAWHDLLQHRWVAESEGPARFRIVRSEPTRAIVTVDHRAVPRAREAWNVVIRADDGRTFRLCTVRSWGTLVGAKRWLRASPP